MTFADNSEQPSLPESAPTVDRHQWEKVQGEINKVIDRILFFSTAFSPKQKQQVAEILGIVPEEGYKDVSVSEITNQYKLLQRIQGQLLDSDNIFVNSAQPKEVSGMLTAMGSVLNSFMRHQDKLDEMEELLSIRAAMVETLKTMPKSIQERFLTTLGSKLNLE